MIRNLKALGLAIVAALALTGVASSAASAAEFHAASAPVAISGSQTNTHVLMTDPGTMTCTTVTFAGELAAKTSHAVTITPSYQNCTLKTTFGNIAVTVNMNGCDYQFNANGEMHIICPVGKNVVISGPGCTITIPPQTLAGAVSYSNNAGKTDFNIHHATAGIKYSYSGFTCGSGVGTTNGTYSGVTTMQGAGGVSIWHE